jgi:CTP:molybdopterin cytidylyltransferase MocA
VNQHLPLVILAAGRARRFGGGVKPLAPIGPADEAVIDFTAYDAMRAGFDRLVFVINHDTGPIIRQHIEERWSSEVDVAFTYQPEAHGTVHAVLCAREAVDPSMPFAVANADDLYGAHALTLLADHLRQPMVTNALVGFLLHRAIVGDEPVTRGVCEINDMGCLTRIDERRKVHHVDGVYRSDDGLQPEVIDPNHLVSLNLWGFSPEMWDVLEQAMETGQAHDGEILLPEVVDDLLHGRLAGGSDLTRQFKVLPTESRSVGVTHPGDLEIVKADVVRQIKAGERPESLTDSVLRQREMATSTDLD